MKPEAANDYISFSVPAVPPSGNTYVRHTRLGTHYVTREAKSFWQLVQLYSKNKQIRYKEYGVRIGVYLGPGQKGDLDNFAKVLLDSLTKCHAIDSDAKVTVLHMFKTRDRLNPRTEVDVWGIGAREKKSERRRRVAGVGPSKAREVANQ